MSRCRVCKRNIGNDGDCASTLCAACESLFDSGNVLMYCRKCGARMFAPAATLAQACSPNEVGLVSAALRSGERQFSVNECPKCGAK